MIRLSIFSEDSVIFNNRPDECRDESPAVSLSHVYSRRTRYRATPSYLRVASVSRMSQEVTSLASRTRLSSGSTSLACASRTRLSMACESRTRIRCMSEKGTSLACLGLCLRNERVSLVRVSRASRTRITGCASRMRLSVPSSFASSASRTSSTRCPMSSGSSVCRLFPPAVWTTRPCRARIRFERLRSCL